MMNEPTTMSAMRADIAAGGPHDDPGPGVTHAINRLESRLATLDRTLAMHSDRLSGVLRPVPPSAGLVQTDSARQPASPIAENLFKFVEYLDQMIAFVEELTMRVDA